MKRLSRSDLLIALGLLLAAAVFIGDTLVGGEVLLPADSLYRTQPWRALAQQAGVGVPYNELIGDLIYQNYPWKTFARGEVLSGRLPLWNPHVFGGMPFLAAGQYGVLYPLGLIFYALPVSAAYEWFAVLHLALAALGAFVLLRVLGCGGFGGAVGGLAYGFCGFLVVSLIWPQVVGAAVWLPWLVLIGELLVRHVEGGRASAALLVAALALLVGTQFLAGHVEISFYVVFSLTWYVGLRLIGALVDRRSPRQVAGAGLWYLLAILLGVGLAAVQLVPFVELAERNFRRGLTTYSEVASYALPARHVLALIMPDFFGNPTHHQYFDMFDLVVKRVGQGFASRAIDQPAAVFWGIKNYVEGAGYVGVVALGFAALALVRPRRPTWILAGLALWSYLLAFGTPLYRLLFALPFFDQLHTPFRWLFPASFALAALAGLGADRLDRVVQATTSGSGHLSPTTGESRLQVGLAVASLTGGCGLVVALVVAHFWPRPALAIARMLLEREERLRDVFSSPAMLASYEAQSLFLLALGLLGVGGIVMLSRLAARPAAWRIAGAGLVFLELYAVGASFLSRSDAALLQHVPPSVLFLRERQEAEGPFRIAGYGNSDVLRPNTAMMAGLEDVRGYDSMFLREYVDYWSLIEPPDMLLFNQMSSFRRPASLRSPFVDLLNVRYVVTTESLSEPGLSLVYDREIRIYERPTALPRAFLVPSSRFVPDGEAALSILRQPGFDPRREVILEGQGRSASEAWLGGEVRIEQYRPNLVTLVSHSPGPGYLVLADSYFPGWQATVDGEPATVYRANHAFRAIEVPAGEHRVVFKYSPTSFRLGLFASFVALIVVALFLGVYLWQRLMGHPDEPGTVRRVGRNSLAPLATSLLNKSVDIAFAMLMLRLLGPENVGKYSVAVIMVGYLDILTNFGLNALLIREVARAPESRHRYLTGSVLLRLGLWVVAAPLGLAILYLAQGTLGLELGSDTLLVLVVLALALIPSNISTAFSSLFYAFERMEYPSALSVVTNLLRIGLGAVALLADWGIVGLAGVSLLVNVVTAGLFATLTVRALGRPRLEFQPGLLRGMVVDSYPLMLNHFLATVFFKVDSLLLWLYQGSTVVGYYATAYKFVDGLQIIPSSFVFAVFPLMSRQAKAGGESLRRAYVVALRVLVGLSLPIAAVMTALAEPLVLLLGGSEYLPHAAIALRVLIWFLPFSFVNGITQYVLIAINQQRFITVSFFVASAFNVLANLYAIPHHGYVGAAATTILSELALMAPFYYCIRRHLGPVPLAQLLLRPAVAGAGMAALLVLGRDLSVLITLPAAVCAYLALLMATRAVTPEELSLGWAEVQRRLTRTRGQSAAAVPAATAGEGMASGSDRAAPTRLEEPRPG